jgi:hypothetical protein
MCACGLGVASSLCLRVVSVHAFCGFPKPEIMNQDIGLKLERKKPTKQNKNNANRGPTRRRNGLRHDSPSTPYIASLIFDEEQSETSPWY